MKVTKNKRVKKRKVIKQKPQMFKINLTGGLQIRMSSEKIINREDL